MTGKASRRCSDGTMASCLLACLAILLTLASVSAAHRSPSERGRVRLESLPPDWEAQLDAFIENTTYCRGMVGLSVSIVLANQSIYAKGFGAASLEGGAAPVDADTMFSIGSTTKAFTSTLLAILMDEGKFPNGWDTLVKDVAADFTFADPVVQAHMRIRDLLAMKTGLSLHALMMLRNGTRDENLYQFQKAVPAFEMRTLFQYHNWMVALAGHLAEIVTGEPWEQLIQTRILQPLNMTATTPWFSEVLSNPNHASPYAMSSTWPPTALPDDVNLYFQKVAPAGSMSTNARDIATWLNLHVNGGTLQPQNLTLVSAANLAVAHSPQFLMQQTVFPATQPVQPFTEANMGYGFGWMKDSYQGREVYWHNGEVFGFNSEMSFMPNEGLAIFTSQTGGQSEVGIGMIRWFATNLLLGLDNSWLQHPRCPRMEQDEIVGAAAPGSVPKRSHDLRLHPPTAPLRMGAKPCLPHMLHDFAPESLPLPMRHQSRHRARHPPVSALAPADFTGTYLSDMYEEGFISLATDEQRAMFSATAAAASESESASSSAVTLVWTWSVMTVGLQPTSDPNTFDCIQAFPWSVVLPPAVWPKALVFIPDGSGGAKGLYWIIDAVQPPFFAKASARSSL